METIPLISIRCITYNHEFYIRDCLDGFVMQKTTFPFIAIVHDDASTDGTAEIIKEYAEKYPNIIKPIYETENQYSKNDGSLERIMNAAIPEDTKYIAFCEGDDYWIDPLKLQKQVDFLERNLEYGMCYTRNRQWNQKAKKFDDMIGGKEFKDFDDLLLMGSSPIATLTVVIRKELYNNYNREINPSNKNWLMGDYPLWIYISHESKVKLLPDITAVYRLLPESASHSTDVDKILNFRSSVVDIQNFFIKKYTNYKTIFYDFHRNKVWLIAGDRRFSRKDVVKEIKMIEILDKKEKLLLFIAKNPFLFILLRFRWKVMRLFS